MGRRVGAVAQLRRTTLDLYNEPACCVAAVILPVGGWLAFHAGTFVADVGGMLLAVALWRTALLPAPSESDSCRRDEKTGRTGCPVELSRLGLDTRLESAVW